jgi:surfeit locus 1 family protein
MSPGAGHGRPVRLPSGDGDPAPPQTRAMRRMVLPLVFGLVGIVVLIGLGTWQVQRLAWKTALIGRIEAQLAAEPVALPETPTEARDEYLQVRAEGVLLPGELHVYTSVPQGGVGYRVIAPFETGGRRVLLDRGFVPIEAKAAERPTGRLAVEGSLLWPQETDRFTAAPDREANIWIARDVALMSEALGTEPVMLVVERSDPPGPTPLPVTADIRNAHLGYAVTWYGLALVWAGMTGYWLWHIKRRTV